MIIININVVLVGKKVELIESYLEEEKIHYYYFETHDELEYIPEFRIDLIILITKGMNGHKIIKISKKMKEKYSKNLLLILEKKEKSFLNKLFENQFNEYLFMPILKDEIIKKIKDIEMIEERLLIFEEYMNKTDNMVVISNSKGIIVEVNKAFLEEMKYSKKEILGQNIKFLRSEQHSFLFYDNLRETIENGLVWKGNFHNVRKDGSVFWEKSTIMPIRVNGYIKYFIKIAENIDEIKKEVDKNSRQKTVASGIQRNLLPQNIQNDDIEIEAGYYPKNAISGDVYKWVEISEGNYIVFLADVVGHGIGSALLTVAIMAFFENIVNNEKDPVSILEELNDRMIKIFYSEDIDEQYFTALIMHINTKSKEIEYINCGHPAIFLIGDEKVEELSSNNLPLGIFRSKKIESKIFKYNGSCEVFIYTDGLIDIPLSYTDSVKILKNVIHSYSKNKKDHLLNVIENEILFHYSDEINDDITMISINLK